MNDEFKKLSQGHVTRYVLESATSIGSSSIASMPMPVGSMQRRKGKNLIAQEADKKTVPASTPRNFVAKNAKSSGAGAHKDKKKEAKQGNVKHKKPYMEALQARLDQLKSKVAEGSDISTSTLTGEIPTLMGNRKKEQRDLIEKYALHNREQDYFELFVELSGKPMSEIYNMNDSHRLANELYNLGSQIASDWRNISNPTFSRREYLNQIMGDWYNLFKKSIQKYKSMNQGMAEGFNGEYDDEAGMAQSNLITTARAVMGLLKTIKDRDNLPEWGQEKIAKAEMMLVSVWDYLQSQKAMGNDPQQGVAEGSDDAKYKIVCKDCGDVFNKPTTDCRHNSHNPNGPNWIKENEGMEEDMSRRGFLKGAGAMAAGISAASGAHADEKSDPNKLIAIVNIDGESKEFNLTGKFKGDVKSQLHQAENFITEFLEKRDINFSNLELRYQGAVLKTQNTGSVKEEQGVAEDHRDNPMYGQNADFDNMLLRREARRKGMTVDQYKNYLEKQKQDQEHELNIGSSGRAELKQKADELAEIKRKKLRQERLEDEELANQRYTKRADREQEMEKIRLQYGHELKLINTEHGNNMEAIRTGNSHELTKMDKEYAEADRERRHASGESDKDRAERAEERRANRQEPIKIPPLPMPANIPSNGPGGQTTVKDEPEDDYYDIPPNANFDPNTGKPLKPQNSQQWHTSQQLQYNKPSKPSKYNNDDVIDVDAKPSPNQPLRLKEKLSVVRDPAHATGIQQTGGITHGSVYIPGKSQIQKPGWQTRQTPVLKHEIAVDNKGRTQKQWIQLVKTKFPGATTMGSKMINGPVQALLPDGRTIYWEPVEQGVAESNTTYFESLDVMLERQLEPTMDLDAWNNNFQNADPQKYHQFKNKTPEKKK